MGVIPDICELTAHPEDLPFWDDVPDKMKAVYARQMERFTGYLEHGDVHLGRVVDNTLVFCIIGDNGGAPESGVNGSMNIFISHNQVGAPEIEDVMHDQIPQMGDPDSHVGYSAGWGWETAPDFRPDVRRSRTGLEPATPRCIYPRNAVRGYPCRRGESAVRCS
ncbi:MAG: hypothetical protein ACR2N9_07805 [Acidimicrobiia bacterium]